MPTNNRIYGKSYMRQYMKNSESNDCDICGGKYKGYLKYKHVKTLMHQKALKEQQEAELEESDSDVSSVSNYSVPSIFNESPQPPQYQQMSPVELRLILEKLTEMVELLKPKIKESKKTTPEPPYTEVAEPVKLLEYTEPQQV